MCESRKKDYDFVSLCSVISMPTILHNSASVTLGSRNLHLLLVIQQHQDVHLTSTNHLQKSADFELSPPWGCHMCILLMILLIWDHETEACSQSR